MNGSFWRVGRLCGDGRGMRVVVAGYESEGGSEVVGGCVGEVF